MPACSSAPVYRPASGPMAVRLGYDRELLTRVSREFARAVVQSVRRRTRRHLALASVRPLHAGVLVVVQRFRYDFWLLVHLHALVTDGELVEHGEDSVRWLAAAATVERDLTGVLAAVRRGLGRVDDSDEDVAIAEPRRLTARDQQCGIVGRQRQRCTTSSAVSVHTTRFGEMAPADATSGIDQRSSPE